ncbi:hypothetical protein [Streptomyces longispororuber]|uniref:hypothetical protein n=1 Tax=Streptomyces longispororuber TaxID=68230 RepID=UPI0036F56240
MTDDDMTDDDVTSREREPRDAEPRDARPRDAELCDAGPRDAEPRDAEPHDAEPRDAEPHGAEPRNAEPRDEELRDAERRHAKPRDAEPRDAEPRDAEPRDAELRRRLRRAAHAHRPDRERMLARVERGMAAGARDGERPRRPERERTPVRGERGAAAARQGDPASRPWWERGRRQGASWLRVAGAAAAVAGVLTAGGYGLATAVRGDDPAPGTRTVATSPTAPAPTPPPVPTSPPAASAPTSPPGERDGKREGTPRPPRRTAAGGAPSTTPPEDPPASARPPASAGPPPASPGAGLVRADGRINPGSNPYWSQSDLTVRATKPLTALTVELRVARAGEVADTGNWRTLPAEDFDVLVAERDGFLVYRWTLRPGRTVPAGRHVFAGQYNHPDGGRDAGDDTYAVHARAAGERGDDRGDFTPASR